MTLRDDGYTLMEVMVSLAVFALLTILIALSFQGVLARSAFLKKSAESNIGGIVGLEMMRSDLEQAGHGLADAIPGHTAPYRETEQGEGALAAGIDPSAFNDVPPAAPRPLAGGKSSATCAAPGIAYLVVKSTRVSPDRAAKKWSYLNYSASEGRNVSYLTEDCGNGGWKSGEQVVALDCSFGDNGGLKTLAVRGDGAFSFAIPDAVPPSPRIPNDDAFKPPAAHTDRIVYGIADRRNGTAALRMPYNRADYYIDKDRSRREVAPPAYCSPGTGTLVKAVSNHADGAFTKYRLLDCLGDMQVVFQLDMDDNGTPGTYCDAAGTRFSTSEGKTLADIGETLGRADLLKGRLKQVFVYLLVQEGSIDRAFTFPVRDPNKVLVVGDPDLASVGRVWTEREMAATFGSSWRRYRWKVYTIAAHPRNF